MIEVTEKAAKHLNRLMAKEADAPKGVRIGVLGGGCSGLSYKLSFEKEPKPGDRVFDLNGVTVYCDLKSLLYLKGTLLDSPTASTARGSSSRTRTRSRPAAAGTRSRPERLVVSASDHGPSPKRAAIVLAAGRSERMQYPKALLIFGKETAIDRVVRLCLEAGCDPVIVVLGHDEARIRENASLAGAVVAVNAAYDTGRTSSIQSGLRALPPDVSGVLLFPIDHAMVDQTTVSALLDAGESSGKPIVVPVHDGRRGHPVFFSATSSRASRARPGRCTRRHGRRPRARQTSRRRTRRSSGTWTPADYHHALGSTRRAAASGLPSRRGRGGRPAQRPPV
jgi:molybdenum cofactor cytidylyltransferase